MISDILEQLAQRKDLSADAAADAFAAIFDGKLSEVEIAALLMGLRSKGETSLEIAAAVSAMRARMIKASVRADAIDVCGTGGDGAKTLNISTAVAIVLAACGVAVAKHGNKAASSQSGATDVLTALGVKTDAPQPIVEACVNELGIGYFAAPLYHPALKNLVPIRKSLGIRTLFNLLGPMCNPAGVTRQMIGVPNTGLIDVFADVLMQTGSTAGLIVCGAGPIDEFSLAGENSYRHFRQGHGGSLSHIASSRLGLMSAPVSDIAGDTPEHNARALRAMLTGAQGAYRDTVLMNAAFALQLAQDGDISDHLARAAEAIDSKRAEQLLDQWIRLSNRS